jgi:long-chain acyl-CoA synthetase
LASAQHCRRELRHDRSAARTRQAKREASLVSAVAEQPTTLIAALARNALAHGDRIAIRERDHGIWQEQNWRALHGDVLALAAALESRGVAAGQAVTVIGDNRSRLYTAMLAIGTLRAFPVPVFPDVPPTELVQYTRHGAPDVAFAEDQEQVDKLLELRTRIGRPALIIYDDPRGIAAYAAPGLVACDSLLAAGRARLAAEPGLAQNLTTRAQAGDIAVLLHSSGTTGLPKGVPLTHANVIAGVTNAARGGLFQPGEEHYAYLPTAWVGDFMFTLGAGVLLHFCINIPERQETVLHDLREVAPTMYLAAPRAWDNMLTRLQVGIAETTRLKRWLYEYFTSRAIALERKKLAGAAPTVGERVTALAGEILVYGPVKDFLGLSRAQRVYTGGEALGEDTFLLFRALGINLKQYYGQTETAAMSAVQGDGDVKLHTVGKPLPGVEMRIDDSGEILVRSGSVISAYFDAPEESARAIVDGWLHTGDAGYFEPDGHLVVLGRVSEVVRTSGGERYIPNYIENRIKFSSFVRNVAVVGANRAYLTAIACIDLEAVGYWAEQRGISYTSYAELSQAPEVRALIAAEVRHVNALLKPELRVRRLVNLHKDFDPDDGEVTRTRKLRRNVIEERYAPLIEALYGSQSSVSIDAKIVYENGQTGTLQRTLNLTEVA